MIKVIKVNKPSWKGFVFVQEEVDALGLIKTGRTGYAEIADASKLDDTHAVLQSLSEEELTQYLED